MKKLVFLSILFFIACVNKEVDEIPHFKEKTLSFGFLQEGYNPSNKWIKDPQNIEMLHETFKSVGYTQILEHLNWKEDWTLQIDNTRSLENLIDSLHLSYDNYSIAPKYYREFWQRRIKESNDQVVYKVLSEIKAIGFGQEEFQNLNTQLVNDTLKYLTEVELLDSITTQQAQSFLDYLVKTGMHESAFNVRSGDNSKFRDITWESEQIYEKLTITKEYMKPWVRADRK